MDEDIENDWNATFRRGELLCGHVFLLFVKLVDRNDVFGKFAQRNVSVIHEIVEIALMTNL